MKPPRIECEHAAGRVSRDVGVICDIPSFMRDAFHGNKKLLFHKLQVVKVFWGLLKLGCFALHMLRITMNQVFLLISRNSFRGPPLPRLAWAFYRRESRSLLSPFFLNTTEFTSHIAVPPRRSLLDGPSGLKVLLRFTTTITVVYKKYFVPSSGPPGSHPLSNYRSSKSSLLIGISIGINQLQNACPSKNDSHYEN